MTVLSFIVALSIVVAIHEYGHYIVGRWSGIGADVFSIGFGPVLYSRVDKRGMRWQIAAIPLGGYVKFKGDANAASGKDADAMEGLNETELRATMHGAPLWARAATVAAGPVFNFILSIFLFAAVIMVSGQTGDKLVIGKLFEMPHKSYTLQEGDTVVSVNGIDVPMTSDGADYDAFWNDMEVTDPLNYVVERDGQTLNVTGPYFNTPVVHSVVPRSAARNAGLEVGDVIIAIDGSAIASFKQLQQAVEGGGGKTLALDVVRDGEQMAFELTPKRSDEPKEGGGFETFWRIGVTGGLAFEPEATEWVGATDAMRVGVEQTWRVASGSVSGLYHMLTGAISSCNLSGPVGIAETAGEMASRGGTSFFWFVAVISTAIGMLNLFPIPMLDGGHLVFYGYEAVTGRPPSDSWLDVLMRVGLTLVLGLMLFGLLNDLFLCR
ncbi:RIP metalloprotease RseP [Shimia sp. Alg240-R146]|uniref:RIP metalloprotease RseP n=1 Tax=Shimia sp. Alg240-R146 TaxID=2993449 RepID=UPI0022E89767|nr:RIP metalloprotease RseP [Shimia sp. Alg240-R146]